MGEGPSDRVTLRRVAACDLAGRWPPGKRRQVAPGGQQTQGQFLARRTRQQWNFCPSRIRVKNQSESGPRRLR
jgi:hypothetical protein